MYLQYITWSIFTIKEKLECPWSSPTNETDVIECGDGKKRCNVQTDPNGWQCCANHGHLAKCPKNLPLMCPQPTCHPPCTPCPENCCAGPYCCAILGGRCAGSGARPCKNDELPPVTRMAYSLLFYL